MLSESRLFRAINDPVSERTFDESARFGNYSSLHGSRLKANRGFEEVECPCEW